MKYEMNIINEIAIREFENKHPNHLFLDSNFEITGPVRIIELAKMCRRLSSALLDILNRVDVPDDLKEQALKSLDISQ